MKKKILFITRSRLDENNGGSNATKGFIRCFSSLFDDCSIICPAFNYNAIESNLLIHCNIFPYLDTRSKIRKGLDVYRGQICANRPFVVRHLQTHQYDIVVVDNSFAGSGLTFLIKQSGAKLITIHHNVERHYQHDNRKEYSILFRFPYIYFAQKAERACLLNSDLNLTLTHADAATFRSWFQHKDLHLHCWGTFEYRHIEERIFTPKQKNQTFVITGALYFIQSLWPIMEFIKRYWPVLQAICPSARLIVAGRNPSQQLQAMCISQKNISIIANPKDMKSIVCQANYYICPINAGSGLKLRIMDGLRQGLPILCHDISTAGYEQIMDDGCMFAYHDEETFASSLQKILSLEIPKEKVYQSFKDCFSFETGIKRLKKILEQEHI